MPVNNPVITKNGARIYNAAHVPPNPHRSTHTPARILTGLLLDLQAAGCTLPDYAVTAIDTLAQIDHITEAPGEEPDLLGADLTKIAEVAAARAQRASILTDLPLAVRGLREAYIARHTEALADDADSIIDGLRPAFEKHAATMAAARAAGLTAATTAAEAIDLGPKAAAAWKQARDAVAQLERLALLRRRMTDVIGIEPYPRKLISGITDGYSYAFSAAPDFWQRQDRWWTGGVQLRSVAETTEDWHQDLLERTKQWERRDEVQPVEQYR